MPLVGVSKLQHLCVALLIEFRDCLEDIGDTPIELLQPVLLRCNAEQLAGIEDSTREGGQELHDALQPHWHRVFVADLGEWCDNPLQATGPRSVPCNAAGLQRNWRQLYQAGQASLKQKASRLGKRLRAMTQAEVQSRQTKHVEIIEAPRSLKRRKSCNRTSPAKQHVQVIPARQRVLSKLGLLHNSSLKHLVRIRPPRKAVQQTASRTLLPRMSRSPAKTVTQKQLPKQRTGLKTKSDDRSFLTGARSKSQQPVSQVSSTVKTTLLSAQPTAAAPSAALIEDDIDWMVADAPPANSLPPLPAQEQKWTVQYLEEHGNNADDISVSSSRGLRRSHTQVGNSMQDKAPVKHGTASWVEYIQWE
ncbi:TPA: Elongin-A [Trebouxia sp. C0004]